ncbi:hypothetical protein VC83_00853 [Pseudogymnoascus destructans]|uniref:Cytochrome P450 n=1 Tax=Pseudogymnoascus destructans TaxID=655981 RepID=A0A177AJP7_9PEZI|nr:uncharacterized protein VC83_00853 [Pseudogymnoascus destructans]OAF62286.1 hypothetical protein VC83_00853 [Pseudogymnoascus destructans]
MSVPEIEAIANAIMIAGSETTATLLSGMTYHLLKNPETLKKLAREIRGAFATEEGITLIGVGKLKYLLAVLDENLREPNSFIPERWLGDSRFASDAKDVLQSFLVGPRNCIDALNPRTTVVELRPPAITQKSWEGQEMYILWQKDPLYITLTARK